MGTFTRCHKFLVLECLTVDIIKSWFDLGQVRWCNRKIKTNYYIPILAFNMLSFFELTCNLDNGKLALLYGVSRRCETNGYSWGSIYFRVMCLSLNEVMVLSHFWINNRGKGTTVGWSQWCNIVHFIPWCILASFLILTVRKKTCFHFPKSE